ncbi:MAG: hypothetical protein PSX80_14465 [bacterium]|nr:hypothetical protein [bacterium]
MATKAKKFLITTETHEKVVFRSSSGEVERGLCSECGIEVDLLTLDAAVNFSGLRTGEIFKSIKVGGIHSLETLSGHLLICRSSLCGWKRSDDSDEMGTG